VPCGLDFSHIIFKGKDRSSLYVFFWYSFNYDMAFKITVRFKIIIIDF
jgi:hypothetical protein